METVYLQGYYTLDELIVIIITNFESVDFFQSEHCLDNVSDEFHSA